MEGSPTNLFHVFLKIFRGNKDRNTVVRHRLSPAIRARFIRIHPVGWRGHISLRAEFYGHKTG